MAIAAKDYIGRVLSGYRLVALLGSGGAGAVFLGERVDDPSVQRAIKVLMPDESITPTEGASFQARFLREAQAASQLRHAHILPILSYHAETSGLSYMELPLMSGGTLAGRIAAGPMSLDDIASYLRQIASALDYAHRQGVIHRDVKGVNVLMDRTGEAYLADFGIARIYERSTTQPLDSAEGRSLTRTGQIIGTPSCMAPEQFTGGPITPQLDIYALGVLTWQMVTGTLPFIAADPLQLALQHLHNPPPSARPFRPELPEPADMALRKALAKYPEDRFESAGAFATAFADGLSGDWHPALSQPLSPHHGFDTTLSESALLDDLNGAHSANGAHLDSRTRAAAPTRRLPENQPRRRRWRVIALALALLVIVVASVLAVPRVLPSLAAVATHAGTPTPPGATATPANDPFKPLVPAGKLLYKTAAPGACDTGGAQWFANVEGQQQHCISGGMTLAGADCPCPLALVKLGSIPGVTFPTSYVVQVRIQSIGISRTDYFGFKFREQSTTPEATTYGGNGFLVNANGQWQYNRYEPPGHRNTLKSGELATTLQQSHVYDLTVNGNSFSFAVDGQTIATAQDSTYSGGILDFAAEPRCVIFITDVALYALP